MANAVIYVKGVIVAGAMDSAPLLLKLDDRGNAVPGFGAASLEGTPLAGSERSYFFGLASSGTKIYAGAVLGAPGRSRVVVIRLLRNGRVDRTFGNNGTTLVPLATASGLYVEANGSVTVSGMTVGRGSSVPAIARLNRVGGQDGRFGSNGRVKLTREGFAFVTDVGLQRGRMIVVGGTTDSSQLLKLDRAGRAVRDFGRNGVRRSPSPPGQIALNRCGGFVTASVSPSAAILLTRYLPGGRTDRTYGRDGVAVLNVAAAASSVVDAVVRGRVIEVAGARTAKDESVFAGISRFRQPSLRC